MSSQVDPTTSFECFSINGLILQALKELKYQNPTLIQTQAIPSFLKGYDLVGQAQTGTGKTAAFAIPILNQINLHQQNTQALILTPTRELAIQVTEAFRSYAKYLTGFSTFPIYGGQPMGKQLQQLKYGIQVVVGTPGRVMDHLRRKSLRLDHLTTIVLDEADEMLKMGFIEDVEWILQQIPHKCQTALFSATMPHSIRNIASKHLNNPQDIKIKQETKTLPEITQRYWLASRLSKLDALSRILEMEGNSAAIIFVRTKATTEEVAKYLQQHGYTAAALHGDMSQFLREKVIAQLKDSTLNIVVATDVAARGLDVERIGHVINYDTPYDIETYIHRIGRTGRAGRTGVATLFVTSREQRVLNTIQKVTKHPIHRINLPSAQQIQEQRIKQFKAKITEILKKEEVSDFRNLVQQWIQQEGFSALDIAAALTFSIQGNRPLIDTSIIESEAIAVKVKKKKNLGFNADDRSQREQLRKKKKVQQKTGKKHKVYSSTSFKEKKSVAATNLSAVNR
ncbi:DEAD/DEAH box helicase [Candidatus Nitrosacidococcus tergens]|uniref:DEAD-box ATP-dependent RNA helicase RhpA n=1 Tax=Candidatus Nitrosacidococcus tergens TaxID=553981 RepID=A0A7G1Q7L4_9GAMM|nr:DEAD/DEAH box helicase [Candidatus Nitrosacidococcus tergens]CAB1274443.1 ATP-dependent RNA helicase DeaD [Candidatus Nitrosacidococcus tergens]